MRRTPPGLGSVRARMLAFALALAPVHQKYLLEARQMQALSFTVHIPLVCFGIAFPAMVMFVEWLGIRTGDPLIGRWRSAGAGSCWRCSPSA